MQQDTSAKLEAAETVACPEPHRTALRRIEDDDTLALPVETLKKALGKGQAIPLDHPLQVRLPLHGKVDTEVGGSAACIKRRIRNAGQRNGIHFSRRARPGQCSQVGEVAVVHVFAQPLRILRIEADHQQHLLMLHSSLAIS